MKIVISVNSSWNLINFRRNLIKSLILGGHEIIILSPFDSFAVELTKLGCKHIHFPMNNNGINPLFDLILFFRYMIQFLNIKPNILLTFTIKPNIYASMASHFFKIHCINNVTGLGTIFINETWLTRIAKFLYKIAFKKSFCIFFQNIDDIKYFYNKKLINVHNSDKHDKVQLLPGSGVDLNYFYPRLNVNFNNNHTYSLSISELHSSKNNKTMIFLFIGRILKDKGIIEFVESSKIVKKIYPNIRFCILGFLDDKKATAIKRSVFEAWISEGYVEYLGETTDVRDAIAFSDCVVLPSYREGTPRSLLEAAAMEKPLIATMVAGCKDVIDESLNGFLCNPLDAKDLSSKIIKMINLDSIEINKMGKYSRLKMEREFDENIVINKYLTVINQVNDLFIEKI